MHFRLPKPLHDWREFSREVTIVVIGVLIAIGLEQLVDHHHWQQKIARANGTMRLELIDDDGPQAYVRLAIARCLDSATAQMQSAMAGAPSSQFDHLASNYSPPLRTWEAQGWQAVLASDVGSHMDSDEIVKWSEPYLLMSDMTEWNQRESDLVTSLHAMLPSSASELQELRQKVAELQSLNIRLAVGARLILIAMTRNDIVMQPRARAMLLNDARARYGNCVLDPDAPGGSKLTEFTSEDQLRRFALGSR